MSLQYTQSQEDGLRIGLTLRARMIHACRRCPCLGAVHTAKTGAFCIERPNTLLLNKYGPVLLLLCG